MEEPFLLRCKTPLARPSHGRLLVKHFIVTTDGKAEPEIKEHLPTLLIQKLVSNGGHEEVWKKLMTIQFRSYTKDQIKSILERNIEYNGKVYFFCGFSNNQIRDQTCFFLQEQDRKIYSILAASCYMTRSHYVAAIKRMFEQFERSLQLKEGEFVFDRSAAEKRDSTGFMSTELAEEVQRICGPEKPSVLQFVCDEFSGVLVHSPGMEDGVKAQFGSAPLAVCHSPSRTIGIIECSQPFSMGYIDVISMIVLAEKGISSDRFLKLHENNLRVLENLEDLTCAKRFLRQRGRLDLLRKIENGISPAELNDLLKLREEEIKKIQIGNKARSTFSDCSSNFRVFVPCSREVFGIKDPCQQNNEKNLKPGECVFQPSLIPENDEHFESVEEIVVIPRPCFRLEDIVKFRLVKDREDYEHLKDCIVFPSHSRLPVGGNKYFVCWDREVVPPPVSWVENLTCTFAEMRQGLNGVFRAFGCIQQCFGYKQLNHISSERGLQEYFAKHENTDELVALAESLFIDNAPLRGTSSSQCQELGKLLSPDFDWNEKRVEAKEFLKSVKRNAKESTSPEAIKNESEGSDDDSSPLLSGSSDNSSSLEPNVWKRMEKRLRDFMKNEQS